MQVQGKSILASPDDWDETPDEPHVWETYEEDMWDE